MQKRIVINQSVLWAAAIIASALLGSNWFLSLVLLPTLAYCSITQSNECSNS
jgi:hypothetical protein